MRTRWLAALDIALFGACGIFLTYVMDTSTDRLLMASTQISYLLALVRLRHLQARNP